MDGVQAIQSVRDGRLQVGGDSIIIPDWRLIPCLQIEDIALAIEGQTDSGDINVYAMSTFYIV